MPNSSISNLAFFFRGFSLAGIILIFVNGCSENVTFFLDAAAAAAAAAVASAVAVDVDAVSVAVVAAAASLRGRPGPLLSSFSDFGLVFL